MSGRSKTLVDIEDLTDVTVGTDSGGVVHVLIGGVDEHQVEVVASVSTMLGLASSVIDAAAGRQTELERRLAEWVSTG